MLTAILFLLTYNNLEFFPGYGPLLNPKPEDCIVAPIPAEPASKTECDPVLTA